MQHQDAPPSHGEPPIALGGLVALAARDRQDWGILIQFYRDLLRQEPHPFQVDRYGEFQLPGLRLGIFVPKDSPESPDPPPPLSLCLVVPDLAATLTHCRQLGWDPVPPQGSSHGQESWIQDPHGTRILLYQPFNPMDTPPVSSESVSPEPVTAEPSPEPVPYGVVLTTAPSRPVALELGHALLEAKLAACINLFPVHSLYTWQGETQSEEEWQLVIKTDLRRWDELEAAITRLHPYEVPELVALPLASVSGAYGQWLGEQLTPPAPPSGAS